MFPNQPNPRFKNGIRQLIEIQQKLLETKNNSEANEELENELSDIETQIQIRMDICVPQAVAALITAINQILDINLNNKNKLFFQQIASIGLLVEFESLLSTHGIEIGMLGDLDATIHLLGHFYVQFTNTPHRVQNKTINPKISLLHCSPSAQSAQDVYNNHPINTNNNGQNAQATSPTLTRNRNFTIMNNSLSGYVNGNTTPSHLNNYTKLNLLKNHVISFYVSDELFVLLPDSLQSGEFVQIKPVLFTQGINEQQSVAIRLGETKLQETINLENYMLLYDYFSSYESFASSIDQIKQNEINMLRNQLDKVNISPFLSLLYFSLIFSVKLSDKNCY